MGVSLAERLLARLFACMNSLQRESAPLAWSESRRLESGSAAASSSSEESRPVVAEALPEGMTVRRQSLHPFKSNQLNCGTPQRAQGLAKSPRWV